MPHMSAGLRVAAAMIGSVLFAAGVEGGQQTGPVAQRLISESTYGPDLYRSYCASCHGKDGRGSGPVSPALKVPPPDLTVLSRQQKGVFPAAEVQAILRGTAVSAHGSEEMPVWGPIFQALDPSDARVKARVASLVSYLQSIQRQ
jgi:mono/diheme cytochrome c family protein